VTKCLCGRASLTIFDTHT